MIELKESEFRGRPLLDFYETELDVLSYKEREPLPIFTLNLDRAQLVLEYHDEIVKFVEKYKK